MHTKSLWLLIVVLSLTACAGKPVPEPQAEDWQERMQQQRDRAFDDLDRQTGQ